MIEQIKAYLNEHDVTLVAVSKTKSIEQISEVYNLGHKDFGENRVQELVEKKDLLPPDIRWHMIGHLQKNKVKYIAPFVHLIHSVDSLKLAKSISKEALKNHRIIPILIQLRIASEESKFGWPFDVFKSELDTLMTLQGLEIRGIMGMGTLTSKPEVTVKEFQKLKQNFEELKSGEFSTFDTFKEISMGMSGDYKIAVKEGSTMVRIGSLIFGSRS